MWFNAKYLAILFVLLLILNCSISNKSEQDSEENESSNIKEINKSEKRNEKYKEEYDDEIENDDEEDEDDEESDENEYDETASEDINSINTNEINLLINKFAKELLPEIESMKTAPIKSEANLNETMQTLLYFHQMTKESSESILKIVMPTFLKLMYEFELTDDCSASVFKILNGIRDQQLFALKFIDASGHLPGAIFGGTIADYGEYEECLNIKIEDVNSPTINGKFCLAKISFPLPPKPKNLKFHYSMLNVSGTPMEGTVFEFIANSFHRFYIARGFRLGICIPSTCSAQELEDILQRVLYPLTKLEVIIDQRCDTLNDKIQLTTPQIISLTTILFLLSLVIIATLIHLIRNAVRKKDNVFQINLTAKTSTFSKIILSFSLIHNVKSLNRTTDSRSNRLQAIHGIRVIGIIWILIGHVYLLQFFQIFHVLKRIVNEMPKLTWYRYQWLRQGAFFQVDTFFLISGVIVSYVMLDILKANGGKFNYYIYVVHRWLRYTPALIGTIMVYILLPLLGSGPIFKESIALMSEPCEKFWWRNLLYYNNLFDATGNCATHSWFLAVDFQLYLIAPIFIFIFRKNSFLGFIFSIAAIFVGMFLSLYLPSLAEEDPTPTYYSMDLMMSDESIYNMFVHLYWATYQHVSPYMIGIILGCFIQKHPQIKMRKSIEIIMWMVFSGAWLWSIFWNKNWMNSLTNQDDPSLLERKIYIVTYKLLWTGLPAWVIFVCYYGRGGIVNRILSWHGFVLLSRLTYSFYLISLAPIILKSYSAKYVQPFDDFYNLSASCLFFVIALAGSFLLFVLFEAPFANLNKIWMEGLEKMLRVKEKSDKQMSLPKQFKINNASNHLNSKIIILNNKY